MSAEEPEKVRRRLRTRLWREVGILLGVTLLLGVVTAALLTLGTGGRDASKVLFVSVLVSLIAGGVGSLLVFHGRSLRRAQELIDLGLPTDALPLLKELSTRSQDEHHQSTACYLTARAYELQGATKLALAYYRDYGKRFPEGAWAIEAKVNARELRRKDRELRSLAVQPRAEEALRCPYCRDALAIEKPHVECESCGTRYHEDCHADRGGCSVFGCASAPASERVSA